MTERVRSALGDNAKTSVDAVSLGRATDYSSVADDEASAKNRREAAMLLSVAEGQLSDGLLKESLVAATQALKIFEGIKDENGEADAIGVLIDAQKAQAELDKVQPTKALETALSRMKSFEQRGKTRAEACMMLAACDVYTSFTKASKDLDKATSYGKDALKTFQTLRDRKMEAAVCLALMNINYEKKLPKETLNSATKALYIYRESGDKKGEARALHGMAMSSEVTDDLTEAVAKAREALSIYEALGDNGAKARELQSIAKWSLANGKHHEALAAAQESLKILRDVNSSMRREAVALLLVCEALAAAGKGRQAVKMAKAGLSRFEETGDKRAVAAGLEVLVEAWSNADAPQEALSVANEALATARELGDKQLELNLLHQLCHIQRHSIEAGNVMRQAVRLAQEINDPDEEAQALLMFGYTQIQRMDIQTDKPSIQEAISLVSDARMLFQAKGYSVGEGQCLICIACLRSLNKDREQVLPLAKEAQTVFNACGDVNGEACAWRMIVEAYLIDRDWKEALDAANSWVDVRRGSGERVKLVDAMLKVAEIHLQQNESQLALTVAEEAQDIISKVGHMEAEAKILCFLAEINLSYLRSQDVTDVSSPLPGGFVQARTKAMDAVKKALMLAGKSKNEDLRGAALLLRAQVLTYTDKGGDALRSAKEAEKVFAKTNSVQNQANAQILCGQLYNGFGDRAEALKLGKSALDLIRQPGCEDPDTEEAALKFIDMLEPSSSALQADAPAQMQIAAGAADTTMAAKPSLDPAMVRSKLYELAVNNINADEDIDADVSLGDAGLDSLASVQFVSDIGREFQINLSPAAVFDYPTLKELTAHVLEESAG